jgi:hypothetical protein
MGVHPTADSDLPLTFSHFTGKSDAEKQAQGKLKQCMVLTHANGVSTRGVPYDEALAQLKTRPITLRFEVPDEWIAISIPSGRIGIRTSPNPVSSAFKVQFTRFTGTSDAEDQAQGMLKPGMVATHVNNTSMHGMPYEEAISCMEKRPLMLRFGLLDGNGNLVGTKSRAVEANELENGAAGPSGVEQAVNEARSKAEAKAALLLRKAQEKARLWVEEETRAARELAEGRVIVAKAERQALRQTKMDAVAAALTARQAAAWAHSLASETKRAITCEFDPHEGFALNAAAQAYCVARWMRDNDDSTEASLTPKSAIRVDFQLLSKATDGLAEKHLLGRGGSCRVFKGDVYGYSAAFKVFDEKQGAWDDRQIQVSSLVRRRLAQIHYNFCISPFLCRSQPG